MSDGLLIVITLALSLVLTLLVELAFAWARRLRGHDLLLVLLVNILTNPAVVYLHLFLSHLYPSANAFLWQVPLEICVVLIEGMFLARFTKRTRHPWVLSVVMNGISWGVGLAINMII